MRSEQDTTRIVRSWLESGSTGIPDRVLDAVMSELPSMPQLRSPWSPGRFFNVKTITPIAAAAAAVVVAVLIGSRFLPGSSTVGGPGVNPSSGSTPITGEVMFRLGGSQETTVSVDGLATGRTLAGTASVVYGGQSFTVALECARVFDAATWILAGEIEESTAGDEQVGTRSAVIVRDDSPQQISLWFEDQPPAEDCTAFVEAIPADVLEAPANFSPVLEGELLLPVGG